MKRNAVSRYCGFMPCRCIVGNHPYASMTNALPHLLHALVPQFLRIPRMWLHALWPNRAPEETITNTQGGLNLPSSSDIFAPDNADLSQVTAAHKASLHPGRGKPPALHAHQKLISPPRKEKLTADARRQAWCTMAEACLRDARRPENANSTRADLAFEACYIWSLSLAAEVLDQLNHPDPAIFGFAADKLGWRNTEFASARMHMATRLVPECNGMLLSALTVLAERLQVAITSAPHTAAATFTTATMDGSHAPANRQ